MIALLILAIIFLLMAILAMHILEESYYPEEKIFPTILGVTFISLSIACFICYGKEKAYRDIEDNLNSGKLKIEEIDIKTYKIIPYE